MKDSKSTMRKTIGWATLAYGAFTAISIIVTWFYYTVG